MEAVRKENANVQQKDFSRIFADGFGRFDTQTAKKRNEEKKHCEYFKTFDFMFTLGINKWNVAYCQHINHRWCGGPWCVRKSACSCFFCFVISSMLDFINGMG